MKNNGNNWKCTCGFIGNAAHAGRCKIYLDAVDLACKNMKTYIAEFYKTTYSITDCCRHVVEVEKIAINQSALRKHITGYLDELGIREGHGGKSFAKFRQQKTKKTMLARYGVINPGQLESNGRKAANKIPYKKLKINQEYTQYRQAVEELTRKEFLQLKKCQNLPLTCYYSGKTFNDELLDKVNPNDPMKRTIDHRVSVTEAFLRGWPPEQTANLSNIVFCLRIVNTIKGHASDLEFRKFLLPMLLKRLSDED